MTIKLNTTQFDFLNGILKDESLRLSLTNAVVSKGENEVYLEINEKSADEIRDYCIEKMQVSGFDEQYKLTKEGIALEELVDKFYS